jgi:hypothetical protein
MGYLGQSCGKPQMDMFLGPLVEDLAQLHVYRRGIEITMESTTLTTKIMMIVTTIYLQARSFDPNNPYNDVFPSSPLFR